MTKKNLMNVILILVCVFLLGCNEQQQESNKKDNSNNTNTELVQTVKGYKQIEKMTLGVDSLTITCFTDGDKAFIVKSNNMKSVWINFYNEKERENLSQEDINRLWRFVKLFYIDKKEKIVLNRTKRGYMVAADYPFIEVISYKEGKKVFKKSTYIGAEEYDIEFNPKFLEFYEFLDGLVKKK